MKEELRTDYVRIFPPQPDDTLCENDNDRSYSTDDELFKAK